MRNPKLVPYETIVRATSGEPEAIDEVLRHYGKRIRLASLENGNHKKVSCFFAFIFGVFEKPQYRPTKRETGHTLCFGSMSILWTKKVKKLCCFFKFLILLLLWCQITNRAMYPLTVIPAFCVFKDCSAGLL